MRITLEREAVSLINLDLNLGKENGLDLAREVRKDHNIPIIMLTGKGDAIDRVVGLEVGSTIICPNHSSSESLWRACGLRWPREPCAQQAASSGQRYVFAGWIFDIHLASLKRAGGEAQELTTSEFNLLEVFVKRPHRVLSRDDIMDLLEGHDWSPFDRSIDNLVARLRKKVEKDPDRPALIKTVRGVGYTFTADVARRASSEG